MHAGYGRLHSAPRNLQCLAKLAFRGPPAALYSCGLCDPTAKQLRKNVLQSRICTWPENFSDAKDLLAYHASANQTSRSQTLLKYTISAMHWLKTPRSRTANQPIVLSGTLSHFKSPRLVPCR